MEALGEFEYSKKDLIGHGAFAVVFKGRYRKNPGCPIAVKCVTKKNLAKSQSLLSKEIKILKELSGLHHENVVALLDCKETTHHVYLIMEYCNGGDLADYLQGKGTLSEDTISVFLQQIAGAMKALNAKGVVHRDLKPQNILLQYPENKHNIPANQIVLKIADFGFARFLQDGVMAATLCGSPMYMAPEVIMSLQYDAKADLWSIGTIVFQCLTGKAPFQAQTPQQLKSYYERHNTLKPDIPNGTSTELKDLLMKMLKRNAVDRISFEEFFQHPFLVNSYSASPAVTVPCRKRLNSDSPPVKEVHTSPLSQQLTSSPHSGNGSGGSSKNSNGTSPETDYVKVNEGELTPKSGSPAEDFVMVSDHFADDSSVIMTKTLQSTEAVLESSGSQSSKPPSNKTLKVDPTTRNRNCQKQKTDKHPTSTSPSRPNSLGVESSPTSQPIPVPSQVDRVNEQMKQNSPNSPQSKSKRDCGTSVSSGGGSSNEGCRMALTRKISDTKTVDIGSISPPNVKFSIGTPENIQRYMTRARSGSNPGASPHRKSSGATPPRPNSNTPPFRGQSPKHHGGYNTGLSPLNAMFCSPARTFTLPDMAACSNDGAMVAYNDGRSYTEPDNLGKFGGLSKMNVRGSPVHQAASSKSPPYGAMMPYSSNSPQRDLSHERRLSAQDRQHSFDRSDSFGRLLRQDSFSRTRGSSFSETGPDPGPSSLPYAQSPSNMEGPIMFMVPALSEETLMEKDHNETVKKLQFVKDVVTEIMELTKIRGSLLSESMLLEKPTNPSGGLAFASEEERLLDQIVLYAQALHYLSSSLQLAKNEMREERLQKSNTVVTLLKEMNEMYHQCIISCKQLNSISKVKVKDYRKSNVTADKLIYNYAIEMCQTAALEEMFGNPSESFRRYQSAQILLHALAQQTKVSRDRQTLEKYRLSVENRLYNLEHQGYVVASHTG